MVRMSSFSERDFSGLSADEVGVKIRIPRGFGLDVANSWLGIEVASKAGIHDARFELVQVKSQVIALPGGFFSGPTPGMEYELRLSNASAGAFRDLQEFVSRGKAEDINIRVVPKLSSSPEAATSIAVWIDLRLSEREGYFPWSMERRFPWRGALRVPPNKARRPTSLPTSLRPSGRSAARRVNSATAFGGDELLLRVESAGWMSAVGSEPLAAFRSRVAVQGGAVRDVMSVACARSSSVLQTWYATMRCRI